MKTYYKLKGQEVECAVIGEYDEDQVIVRVKSGKKAGYQDVIEKTRIYTK